MRRALVAACLLVLLAAPVRAATFGFGPTWSQLQQPVEQQSPDYFFYGDCLRSGVDTCVYNPTSCAWDVDDQAFVSTGVGVLAAGASVQASLCMVADGRWEYSGDMRPFRVDAAAKESSLVVRLTSSDGLSRLVSPAASGRAFAYVACQLDAAAGPYPTVVGSNGGAGRVVTYTLTLMNPTAHAVRDVSATLRDGWVGGDPPC